MNIYEMAKKYYPRLWSRARLEALAGAGRLTEEEVRRLLEEKE